MPGVVVELVHHLLNHVVVEAEVEVTLEQNMS
jgi:hypothetical protein